MIMSAFSRDRRTIVPNPSLQPTAPSAGFAFASPALVAAAELEDVRLFELSKRHVHHDKLGSFL